MSMESRLRTISATTTGCEQIPGAPEQFTLIPTTSDGAKSLRQPSRAAASPVSDAMPRRTISATTAASTFSVCGSMELAAFTDTTAPGYGPGMPGWAVGLNALTTRYFGVSCNTAAAAGMARKVRRSIIEV